MSYAARCGRLGPDGFHECPYRHIMVTGLRQPIKLACKPCRSIKFKPPLFIETATIATESVLMEDMRNTGIAEKWALRTTLLAMSEMVPATSGPTIAVDPDTTWHPVSSLWERAVEKPRVRDYHVPFVRCPRSTVAVDSDGVVGRPHGVLHTISTVSGSNVRE